MSFNENYANVFKIHRLHQVFLCKSSKTHPHTFGQSSKANFQLLESSRTIMHPRGHYNKCALTDNYYDCHNDQRLNTSESERDIALGSCQRIKKTIHLRVTLYIKTARTTKYKAYILHLHTSDPFGHLRCCDSITRGHLSCSL